MNKDELMQMASNSGLTYLDGSTRADFNVDISEQLTEFANAILERAATALDKKDQPGKTPWVFQYPSDEVRALKIKEGE